MASKGSGKQLRRLLREQGEGQNVLGIDTAGDVDLKQLAEDLTDLLARLNKGQTPTTQSTAAVHKIIELIGQATKPKDDEEPVPTAESLRSRLERGKGLKSSGDQAVVLLG